VSPATPTTPSTSASTRSPPSTPTGDRDRDGDGDGDRDEDGEEDREEDGDGDVDGHEDGDKEEHMDGDEGEDKDGNGMGMKMVGMGMERDGDESEDKDGNGDGNEDGGDGDGDRDGDADKDGDEEGDVDGDEDEDGGDGDRDGDEDRDGDDDEDGVPHKHQPQHFPFPPPRKRQGKQHCCARLFPHFPTGQCHPPAFWPGLGGCFSQGSCRGATIMSGTAVGTGSHCPDPAVLGPVQTQAPRTHFHELSLVPFGYDYSPARGFFPLFPQGV